MKELVIELWVCGYHVCMSSSCWGRPTVWMGCQKPKDML